jgi:F0F1-type ATP synthase assembly protein I
MDKGKLSTSANLLRVSTIGLNFVLCTFAGLGLGWLLRRFFHLGDWVMIVGLLFGIVASYVTLAETVQAMNREQKRPPAP